MLDKITDLSSVLYISFISSKTREVMLKESISFSLFLKVRTAAPKFLKQIKRFFIVPPSRF